MGPNGERGKPPKPHKIIRRSGEWPGQYGVASALSIDAESGVPVDSISVVQYHYQVIDANEQEFVPYQMLVVAPIVNDTLYTMPNTWLHSQDHLLRKGEVDPHKFVGRDDRPANGR